eukprot:scaffold124228_cov26-Tisochrysis_lutea.AAC.3
MRANDQSKLATSPARADRALRSRSVRAIASKSGNGYGGPRCAYAQARAPSERGSKARNCSIATSTILHISDAELVRAYPERACAHARRAISLVVNWSTLASALMASALNRPGCRKLVRAKLHDNKTTSILLKSFASASTRRASAAKSSGVAR